MDLKAVVVSGEAPESDEDNASIVSGMGFPSIRTSNYCGTIISGEAPESDDDGVSLSSVSGAVDAMTCMPEMKIPKSKKHIIKYNSLLHRKLYESNQTLEEDLMQVTLGKFHDATQKLSTINKDLLKSELIIQEAVCQINTNSNRLRDTLNVLNWLLDKKFLSSIKT
ncbi:hypothetical protein ANTQUA_LOCUS4324 [Anthophora quadrimaculata]